MTVSDTNPPAASDEGTFTALGVSPTIAAALTDADFISPFPIQHLAIPIALQGSDLIGQARTGTGKTLAFGVPLIQRIALPGDEDYDAAAHHTPQALVMCPTRELALQVTADLRIAAARSRARILTVYGGVGYEPQLDGLSDGVDIVVGTPGRLLDLLGRHNLILSDVKVLVLDEADEMLDLGFLPDVERLIAKTPTSRQTMLFSATMPSAIVSLARAHLRQPVNIRAEAYDSQITVPETTQYVYQAHDLDKPAIIGKLLQSPSATRVMVFCRTKRNVQRLTDELLDRGFSATCIHGDLSQVLRERALAKFKDGKAQVIVATDVAARGIDVDQVSHVVNYDCPDDEKTYVHRIGRTGRAGREGIAVTLVDWADLTRWKLINKALNLPFDTPLEAYSTTPELLHDLDIPENATGRLTEAQPRPRTERESSRTDRPRGDRSSRSRGSERFDRTRSTQRPDRPGGAEASDTSERPRRRNRMRRRNGVVIPADDPAPGAAGRAAQIGSGATAPVSTGAPDESGDTRTEPTAATRSDVFSAATAGPDGVVEGGTSGPEDPSGGSGDSAAGRPRRRRRRRQTGRSDEGPAAAGGAPEEFASKREGSH
jgi:superfamily II DNA/RNA helicase